MTEEVHIETKNVKRNLLEMHHIVTVFFKSNKHIHIIYICILRQKQR